MSLEGLCGNKIGDEELSGGGVRVDPVVVSETWNEPSQSILVFNAPLNSALMLLVPHVGGDTTVPKPLLAVLPLLPPDDA